jgi:hypothetical protein
MPYRRRGIDRLVRAVRARAASVLLLAMAVWLGCDSIAQAEPIAHLFHPPDPYRRAGNPQVVHRYAKPTYTPHYCFGYVGGGAAYGGQPRTLEEGTWGMDYCGYYLPHRVWQNWYHGRRAQGGVGRYETDGPHILKK